MIEKQVICLYDNLFAWTQENSSPYKTMDQLTQNWQAAITLMCVEKLGRELSPKEFRFISAKLSYLALEFLEDTIRASSPHDVQSLLNSEIE